MMNHPSRFLIAALVALCCPFVAARLSAQTPRIDSLKQALAAAKDDTAKVRLLNDLAYLQRGDPAQARATAEKAYALAKRLGDNSGAAGAKNHIARAYNAQSSFAEAERAAEEALTLARAAGDKSQEAEAYIRRGGVQWRQGNYDAALDLLFKALALAEETGDKAELENTLFNLGITYSDMGNYASALEYMRKTLTLCEELGDKRSAANTINNIANIYMQQGKHDSALVYLRRELGIATELKDKDLIKSSLLNMGESNLRLGRFSEAQAALEEGLALAYAIEAKEWVVFGLHLFSQLSAARGDYSEAVRYGVRAIALADSIGDRADKRDALKALSEAYAGKGEGLKALAAYKDFIALRDSLVNDENTKKAASREAKYAADKKDKEILLLKKDAENQALLRNSLAVGFVLVIVIVGILFVSNGRRKATNIRLNEQKDLLEAQAVEIQLTNTQLQEKNIEVERAHEQSETLLLNILPAPIAHRLKSGERAIADRFDSVTVLFADIVGFTKLSAQTTPEELVQGLNAIFERFDELAKKYGLEKIKTIGDAYMVAGGLPECSDDHCERVALFALDMVSAMREESLRTSTGEKVELRIGLHTGEAVAGVIGTSKFAYDLWGDTVNTASRMESHGEAGKIHCSEEVFLALKDTFTLEERGEIEVKGKGMMRTWLLVTAQTL
jgi:adenylate cyclase